MPIIRTLEERFWPRVDVRGTDECWPWLGRIDEFGYGVVNVDPSGKKGRTHRVSYELTHGPIGDPLRVVMHSCDNRPCVNPAHLSLGSRSDNAADRHRKGRTSFGSAKSNLTDNDVLAIRVLRALGVTYQWIGDLFGTTYQNAFAIASRRSWRHLP